ncbi:protein TIFY 10A [Neltuma alba]|uniref:protein TIFY 10A n=1 Tax=Neltuma alba TaxID=207710 RepID=UPI0010A40AD3|nr:protein TIFY 10A-like [Prosopis alba]
MSKFPDLAVDGRRLGKAPERSNFTQYCNVLSQLLKEKRGSGSLSIGMAGKMESRAITKDSKRNLENPDDTLGLNASAMECLPQFVENACIKKSDSRSDPEPQLTIFYAGKVLVFDAFAPEKATEIMELATKLSSHSTVSDINKNLPSASTAKENKDGANGPQNNTAQEQAVPKPGPAPIKSDMRYPRRASLLKFLEKRKERVIAKGPYQLNSPNNPKPDGSSSGGDADQGQSSKSFDLNM